MWDFVVYVVVACLVAWVFKLAVGFFSLVVHLILMAFLGFKEEKIGLLVLKRPKVFFGCGVFIHATVGSVYAVIIMLLTYYHMARTGGSPWLYVPLSFIWGFSLLNGAEGYHGTLFSSCLIGLGLAYAGLGILGPMVAWPLVLIASLFYCFGRIDMLRQNLLESGEYDQLMTHAGES